MSEQNRSVVSSSLEEVFLSGEFSRAPDEPTLAPAERADLGPGKAFDHPLEEVFLSDAFGKNGEPTLLDTSSGARAEAAGASLSPFRPMPPWRIRYRAAAAASSVAAAAMVVSVMASGGGPPGVPTIAAAGPGGGAQGGGTGSRGPADDAPNTAAPLATPADDSTASAGGNTGASVGRGGTLHARWSPGVGCRCEARRRAVARVDRHRRQSRHHRAGQRPVRRRPLQGRRSSPVRATGSRA